MRRMLFVLMATIGFATTAHCQAPPAGTTAITFQSSIYSDIRQVLARQAATGTVTIRASLRFPEQVRDRYPAIIVVHTIAGYRDVNEGYAAAELRKSGFATLTYDSFAARKTTGMAMSGSPAYLPAGVVDAYAALRRLANEPRINANRIAILGFSFGAEVAHMTAFESLRSALSPDQVRFAAHVAFYPAGNFGVIAEHGAYTGSPVLMLLGEKDDNLPVAKIESYLAYARGAAAPIENVIYPGAYHAWTVPDLVTARFYPEFVSTKKCPLILLGQTGRRFSSTVRQSHSTKMCSALACATLPDTRWGLMQPFARNRSLMRCGSCSEISSRSARLQGIEIGLMHDLRSVAFLMPGAKLPSTPMS